MDLLKDKYKALSPTSGYLSDVVVLAQAWKKAHAYIRRHNWYQNTLELDCSAIELDAALEGWSGALKRGDYQPTSMRLVPAPKSGQWTFADGWRPKDAADKQVLRPLAHIGIREQTVSTAAMLCLADCVETAQGNPTIDDPLEARAASVYSYGNRLYCRWDDSGRAHFSWGNSDVYSRYYQDYKSFVSRPLKVAQDVEERGVDGPVFVVKIDLSAFFDTIDIEQLVAALKIEYTSFRRSNRDLPAADAEFWNLLRAALTFRWSDDDLELAGLLKGGAVPDGLPQGMVSSGFFANAYLLDFDRAAGNAVKKRSFIGAGRRVQLHDYCRYVDDLRLVVSARTADIAEGIIADVVSNWVQGVLDASIRSGRKLQVNSDKTEVERYSAIGGSSGVAARMNAMQKELSGPFDVTTLSHVEAGLQGLLSLAELGLQARAEDAPIGGLALSSVATPKLEVRDDTLTRFSAYRLVKALRLRRSMSDLTERTEDGLTRDALLHEFEVSARRLVAAWAVNPSLVQVLLYGLDLFPSPDLLRPVTEALLSKIAQGSSDFERRVAWYVLSELFRAGATETGRKGGRDSAFPVGDLDSYRAQLCDVANIVIGDRDSPWYVLQQALLLLASVGKVAEERVGSAELLLHFTLNDYVRGSFKNRSIGGMRALAVALVGHQIRRDPKHFVAWFRSFVRTQPVRDQIARSFEVVCHADARLFEEITKTGAGREAVEAGVIPRYLGEYVDSRWTKSDKQLPVETWITLSKVITHPENPFVQENALLLLTRQLVEMAADGAVKLDRLTPLSLEVRAESWSRLTDPNSAKLKLRFRPGHLGVDPRYSTPPWCVEKQAWLYAVGRIVRAAAVGDLDFTARHWILREEVGWYRGIHSSWMKRVTGMSQAPTVLGGSTAGITQWLSELLLKMLGWPGISSDSHLIPGMDQVQTPRDLLEIVDARIRSQAALYAKSCDMPVYVHPVDWTLRSSRSLRVAILQGLMPTTEDMKDGLEKLDDPMFRAKHRNHLASLLHVAHRKIIARDTATGADHRPRVDLVVAPEYGVHVDDQDLMRQFSDSLGAMLFYGLAGMKHPKSGAHVNAARWLVPQHRNGKRSWVEIDQGKANLTAKEKALGVVPWRPYQAVIELNLSDVDRFRIAGAICYDATDIALAADLRDVSHAFVISALNQDVGTFDSMAAALRYHMYQHILIANSGEFGGSTAQAPYDKDYKRLISHSHGGGQLSVSVFDIEVDHFGPALLACSVHEPLPKHPRTIGKTPPAGLKRK